MLKISCLNKKIKLKIKGSKCSKIYILIYVYNINSLFVLMSVSQSDDTTNDKKKQKNTAIAPLIIIT